MAMPLCQCGHAWGDHAMPPHMDYDIDNGERWCYADFDQCPCKRYVVDLIDALKRGLSPAASASDAPPSDSNV